MYVNKGSDMSMFGIQEQVKNDESMCYQAARYLSSNGVVWRVLEFPIHHRHPPVIHLQVYLENGQRHTLMKKMLDEGEWKYIKLN